MQPLKGLDNWPDQTQISFKIATEYLLQIRNFLKHSDTETSLEAAVQ